MSDTRVAGRVLGLDVGERWIGVALSDPSGTLATPLTRIRVTEAESAVEAIRGLAREHEVRCVVAGMPYSMDGSLGEQARRTQGFVETLAQHVDIPVETWDERLSTVAAERMMIEAGVGERGRKGLIDAAAAAVILQGYLDKVSSSSTER